MVIDAHTHIGFNNILRATPKDLVVSMKKAGIDRALVFGGELNACSNGKLFSELKPYKGILFPVGSVSPLSKKKPSVQMVDRWLAEKKIYGLKFYPGYEQFHVYDRIVESYLRLLEKYRRPAIFHTGDTYNAVKGARLSFAMPLTIDEIAVRHPNLPIVIAHMGNPWLLDAAEVAFKNANVFYDCSGWVYGAFKTSDRAHFRKKLADIRGYTGSFEKMLFGTDWPISHQTSYVSFVRSLPLTAKERKKIFAQNAIDAFRLPVTL